MEFSVRSYAVVSFLLLVSLSADMSGPLEVDAQFICDPILCREYCSGQGLPGGCCPGIGFSPCQCTVFCPFADSVTTEITEKVTAGATDEERFIKETVIA